MFRTSSFQTTKIRPTRQNSHGLPSPRCARHRQHKIDSGRAEDLRVELARLANHACHTANENMHQYRKPPYLDEYLSMARMMATNPGELDIKALRETLANVMKPQCGICTYATWPVLRRQGNVMNRGYKDVRTLKELKSLLKQAVRAQKARSETASHESYEPTAMEADIIKAAPRLRSSRSILEEWSRGLHGPQDDLVVNCLNDLLCVRPSLLLCGTNILDASCILYFMEKGQHELKVLAQSGDP